MKVSNLISAHDSQSQNEEFGVDVLIGLSAEPKSLSAKYFYDDQGSELFQKISQQPEYYLTKKEFHIFEDIASKLPKIVDGSGSIDIIELGAGDGHKSKLLIDGFIHAGIKVNYYPIDISEKAMLLLESNIRPRKNLEIHGVVSDYLTGLTFVRSLSTNRQLVLFLGSNIGNLDRGQSLEFLRKVWNSLSADDFVLIGFDLKKETHLLNAAYNDAAGHTRMFNLNLLTRINRELGGDFELDQFRHYGFYNPTQGAMESYLISLKAQEVPIRSLKKSFSFGAYEPIHLEYSFKYLPPDIEFLCTQTGFSFVKHFSDVETYFIDSLWKVTKDLS